MSTAYLLSTHSSNPLEAPPSDPRNRAFVRTYQQTKAQLDVDLDTSDDERKINDGGTVRAYHSHIAELYPEMGGRLVAKASERWESRGNGREPEFEDRASPAKVDLKGKGRAVPGNDDKENRTPGFVDLDDDMSDEGVPAPGECRVALNEEEQNPVSQDPAGSGAEDGSDETHIHEDDPQEDNVDADPTDIPEVEDAGSSSSTHMPSSSLSLLIKPPDEQHDIQIEMSDLEHAVPSLAENYHLVDRLGSGTFSSVYKAVDLNYEKYDNTAWERTTYPLPTVAPFYVKSGSEVRVYVQGEDEKKRDSGRVYVAVKRIYVTSGPERVRNELAIMEDCLGCRHISQLITAFRYRDQVVAVMPYCRNDDFRVRASY